MPVRDLVLGVPQPKVPSDEVQLFLRNLDACLAYHHDAAPAGRVDTTTRDLALLLDRHFFSDLYVDRPELRPLRIACDDTNLLILSGLLGSGKTTLLRKLQDVLLNENVPCVRLDVDSERQRLEELKGRPDPICALAYRQLRSTFIDQNPQLAVPFSAFEVQHNVRYGGLASAIRTSVAKGHSLTDAEWDAILSEEPYRTTKLQLDVAHQSDEDLVTLLDFLQEKLGGLILIFDNIDNFPSEVPRDVIRKCRRVLRGHCTPIVAVRASTLRLIGDEDTSGRQNRQPDQLELKPYLAKTPATTMPRPLTLGTHTNTVQDVMLRRIEFLVRHGHTRDVPEPFLSEFNTRVSHFFNLRYATSFLHTLSEWDNHSIRHVASDLGRFTAAMVLKRDPAIDDAKMDSEAKRGRIRIAKSWLYKHLTCKGHLIYERDTGAIDLFRYGDGNELVPFPLLALLLFLSNSQAQEADYRPGTATFDAMCGLFASLGFSNEKSLVCNLVNECVNPVLHGSLGKVLVHNSRHRLHAGARPTTLIELQPRGSFLLERLCFTAEYLFWVALASTHAPAHYAPMRYVDTGDDSTRGKTASRFVEDVIWKKLKAAEVLVHKNPRATTVRDAYARIFPMPGAASFVLGAVVSLQKFVAGARRDIDTEARLNRLKQELISWQHQTSSGH